MEQLSLTLSEELVLTARGRTRGTVKLPHGLIHCQYFIVILLDSEKKYSK